MYLAGDIGGTKTHLALYQGEKEKLTCKKDEIFPSGEHKSLEEIVQKFLDGVDGSVERACFGIAGPVKDGRCQATNLPWIVDAKLFSKELGIEKVALLNDLEANAYGLKTLSKSEFHVLNEGKVSKGNQALISAGTGLGEAGLYFDGKNHHPFACEGGHVDFAPRDELEVELLWFLQKEYGHASYERVVSGPGIYNLYRFLVASKKEDESDAIFKEISSGNQGKMIQQKAESGESRAAKRAIEWFLSLYASEAANTALKFLAIGGVFLGGGIAPKLLHFFDRDQFMESFTNKGRFAPLLSDMPVSIVLNEETALAGALQYALELS